MAEQVQDNCSDAENKREVSTLPALQIHSRQIQLPAEVFTARPITACRQL